MRTHGRRLRNALVMLLALGAAQADATLDDDMLLSTSAGFGGTSAIALGAAGGVDPYAPLAVLLGAGTIVGASVTTSDVSGNRGHWNWRKLLVQLKADHDTYLTGGEMTPSLQALYREVRRRRNSLAPEGTIDEARMTEAIDRLNVLAEGPAR